MNIKYFKIGFSTILICFILNQYSVLASVVSKPSFKDYCPSEYYHKELITRKDVKRAIPQGFVIAGYIAFGVPGILMNVYNNRTKDTCVDIINNNIKFWYMREVSFEKNLKECETTENIKSCYAKLEERELMARTMFEQSQSVNRKTISDWYR